MRQTTTGSATFGAYGFLARVLGGLIRALISPIRWIGEVRRHSGLAGLLIVGGLITSPVAFTIGMLQPEPQRELPLLIGLGGFGVLVIGAVWRRLAIRHRNRTLSRLLAANVSREMNDPAQVDWAMLLQARRLAGQPNNRILEPNWAPPNLVEPQLPTPVDA